MNGLQVFRGAALAVLVALGGCATRPINPADHPGRPGHRLPS